MSVISLNNALEHSRMSLFQPGSQSWPKIKIQGIKIASLGIWRVTLGGDLLIKIGKWRGGWFWYNLIGKGILARGLIEMPMQAEIGGAGYSRLHLAFVGLDLFEHAIPLTGQARHKTHLFSGGPTV
jgi:hypothetical protein